MIRFDARLTTEIINLSKYPDFSAALPTIILIGILGSLAGDAATVILPPLAAMIFIKIGYHHDCSCITS
jgi:p-aminobenzoyl-glutamate transporter AbgT